jgi:acyl carrier protein
LVTTQEITEALIELFGLEDTQLGDLDAEAPLFNEGLGLDSVDAIELTIFLDNEYGIRFANMADSQQAFASIRTLTEYVNAHAAPGASDDA